MSEELSWLTFGEMQRPLSAALLAVIMLVAACGPRQNEVSDWSDWEPVVPRIQAEIRDLRRKISAELTPEQRERFEALFERRESNQTPRESKSPRRTNSAPEVLR